MRPKSKMLTNNNNNMESHRYPQHLNENPNFHFYPPAVYTMHGSSGNAYVNGNTGKIQACAPAPVYVNAPPKPRRTSNIQPALMVTGKKY